MVNVILLIITVMITPECLGDSLGRPIFCCGEEESNQSQNQWRWKQNSEGEFSSPQQNQEHKLHRALTWNVYISAFSSTYSKCHICLVGEEIMLPTLPSPITIFHSTYWAKLHLSWNMTKEYRWISCPSPALRVMKDWGPSSGQAGK